MATVQVQFKDGFNKQIYSYRYNPLVWNLKVGDSVVVNSPRNGYVVVEVVKVEKEDRPQANKDIVCKVNDAFYLEELNRRNAQAERERKVKERIAKLNAAQLEELLAIYEDA